jgi:hypothetical protein
MAPSVPAQKIDICIQLRASSSQTLINFHFDLRRDQQNSQISSLILAA